MVTILNDENFEETVKKSPDRLIVIDFFATWCGPCKRLAPQLEAFAKKTPNVDFFKIDVDDSPKMTKKYKIKAMPTILLIKGEKVLKEIVGADFSAIKAGVERYA